MEKREDMKQGVIAATLAVLIGFAGCSSTQVVRIGHAAPLTGQIAHLGNDNRQGAQLAIEDLNAKGPRIAGKPVRFELVSEDDQADPRTAVAAAQRLVDAKVVAVVGHLNSGTSVPASTVYSQAGIPMITPSATNPRLTQRGLRQTFRLIGDDVTLATVLARYSVKTLGARRVALVDDRSAYGQGMADAFEAGARGAGAAVAGREFANNRTTDFGRIVTALAARDPDVVFFGGMDTQAGPLLKEMQRQGLRARLVGGDGICTSDLARLAGGSLPDDRVWCGEAGTVGVPETPEGEVFRRGFAKRFSTMPILYSPYTYDAVQLLAKAMVDAGSADPRVFTPTLAKTAGWQGIMGLVSFDAKGDLVDAPVTVFTYRDNLRTQSDIAR
jgi:branched-chain amino acid transport system substrate-binding protein